MLTRAPRTGRLALGTRVPFLVGAFRHYDQIFEGRTVRRAATPSPLDRAPAEPTVRYEHEAESNAETIALWRGVVDALGRVREP